MRACDETRTNQLTTQNVLLMQFCGGAVIIMIVYVCS